MKKLWVAYGLYLILLCMAVFLSYAGLFDKGNLILCLMIGGVLILIFCLGGYAPIRNYRLETEYSLKEAVDSKNDPLLILPALLLLLPLVAAIYILMQLS